LSWLGPSLFLATGPAAFSVGFVARRHLPGCPMAHGAFKIGKFALLIAVVFVVALLWGYLSHSDERSESRGYLGISFAPISTEQAKALGTDRGLIITEVLKGSAAESSGLRLGDVIIRVDGDLVADPGELNSIRSRWEPNQAVTLHVLREASGGAQEIVIEVHLMTFDELSRLKG
jgi:S1-C subfamily serine protease